MPDQRCDDVSEPRRIGVRPARASAFIAFRPLDERLAVFVSRGVAQACLQPPCVYEFPRLAALRGGRCWREKSRGDIRTANGLFPQRLFLRGAEQHGKRAAGFRMQGVFVTTLEPCGPGQDIGGGPNTAARSKLQRVELALQV